MGRAGRLLNELGATVRDGADLVAGPARAPDGTDIELVPVHPVHARSDLLTLRSEPSTTSR